MTVTQRSLDRVVVWAVIVVLFKQPVFFVLSLAGVVMPPLYDGINAVAAPVIMAALVTKIVAQRRLLLFSIASLPFVAYTIREFTYGAPVVFLIKGFVFDFGVLIAVLVGVASAHDVYTKGFRTVAIGNAIAIIGVFCAWPVLGGAYTAFLDAYGLSSAIAFRSGIVSVNGVFGAGQVAGTFSVIAAFVFWGWRERGWAVVCLLAGLFTTAKSALFMMLIGALLMILFGRGSPRRRAALAAGALAAFAIAYVGYTRVIEVPVEGAQQSYSLATLATVASIADSPWIGHGFAIFTDDPATRVYANKAPLFNGALAVSMRRADWFEFAFVHPWIKHGLFYLLFYYGLFVVKRRNVEERNRMLYWMLLASNFHYPVINMYTGLFLLGLAARPIARRATAPQRVPRPVTTVVHATA